MSTGSPFCILNCPCDEALPWAKTQLLQAGLRVLQTFDLKTVCGTPAEYQCSHHDPSECDCQLVILLIYGRTSKPTTLVLQGDDNKTLFLLESDPFHQLDPVTCSAIKQALQSTESQ